MREKHSVHLAGDRALASFAALTAACFFVVVTMGMLVTDSGSEHGCGPSWPLCHGRLLPGSSIQSIIEWSHRAITGVAGILLIVLVVWAWRRAGHLREVRWLVFAALGFVVVQSLLGAAAVLWPQPGAILALHFGISLIAFAATFLLAVVLHQERTGRRISRATPIARSDAIWLWTTLAYVYAVVYSGAFVNHIGAGPACSGWPLCNGSFVPHHWGFKVGVIFLHRLAAAGAAFLITWLALRSRKWRASRPDLYRGSLAAWGLVLTQVAMGGVLVATHIALWATLVHGALVALLFASLAYMAFEALPHAMPVASADLSLSSVSHATEE